jgi:hypothetical protein
MQISRVLGVTVPLTEPPFVLLLFEIVRTFVVGSNDATESVDAVVGVVVGDAGSLPSVLW